MRIRQLVMLMALCLCCLVPLAAQDSSGQAYNAALKAALAAKPDLGKPGGSSWARLSPTTLSNLGCPLVQGTELGREVIPYAIGLDFPSGTYIVHATVDGRLTQLCDTDFGTITASTPAPPSGCQLAAVAQPTFRIAPDSSTAILGGDVMVNGINYAIGRTENKDWLQTRNTANQVGWVSIKEVTLNGDCDSLPSTAATNEDYITGTCYITPAQEYSNVRKAPSTDAEIVDGIYENTYWQVYATAGDGTDEWVFINKGWIAKRVTESYGDCSQVDYDPSLVISLPTIATATPGIVVVTPSATVVPTLTPTPLATSTPLPANLICPPDFKGYMKPRISIGVANVRVAQGGLPNRLRTDPTVDALQIGEAQPGRTFDKVVSGPACSDTYVWWYVEIDGNKGWTVESDSSDGGTYFLEPLQAPATNSVQATPVPQAASPLEPVTLPEGEPITDLRVLPDGAVAALEGSNLYLWSAASAAPVLLQSDVVAFDTTPDRLIALGKDETLSAYDSTTRQVINLEASTMTGTSTSFTVDFMSDARYFLTVACNDTACAQGKIDLWETGTGKLIRSQPAHKGEPFGAWFTPDDKYIFSLGVDGIQVWDTLSGAFVNGVSLNLEGTSRPTLMTTADSSVIYLGYCLSDAATQPCANAHLTSWRLPEMQQVSDITLSATSAPQVMALSPNNRALAVALADGTLQIWQVNVDGVFELSPIAFTAPDTTSLAWDNGQLRLFSGSASGMIQAWTVSPS